MAEQLASVPEENTSDFTAAYPPIGSYRESIRSVAWPQWRFRSTISSLSGSGPSGSNYSSGSSALSSYFSNNSDYSSDLGSAGAADFRAGELTEIAHRMVSDGYTQRMVQAFTDGGGEDRTLENWFVELDVDWVLKARLLTKGHYYSRQKGSLLLENTSASWHRELIEKWVRAFTIIVASMKKELVAAVHHETLAVAQFGESSISAMLVVVQPIMDVFKAENLQHMLDMYICVSSAAYDMFTMHNLINAKAQSLLIQIGNWLETRAGNLIEAISTTMNKVTLYGEDDSWAIEILQGGGEVHNKTRLMMDGIVLMRKTQASTRNSSQSKNSRKLCGLIQDTINRLNNLILTKSELCLDPSLRYLFQLNNSYFIAQMSEPSLPVDVELSPVHHTRLKLIPECEKYMDSFLDSSWGYVVSCILQSNSLGEPKNRKKNSPLAKFQSAFHQTYQAQKFWKVPDPQLRSLMRETITKIVISGYCDYLNEHPELEKQVRGGSNSPKVFEEMLGKLFEG
jgi:hypothetical protein